MPLFLKHTEPLWGVWKIEESRDEMLSHFAQRAADLLPADMRAEKRQQEWLAVRLLLRDLLGEETRIAYRPNGAPFLPEKNLHISISHTRGYAAVILSEQAPVGIDIEYLSDRVLKVRSRFMRPEEEAMIDAGHEVEHSLVCWCAKETLFKLIGRQEVDLREHIHIRPFPFTESSGSLTVGENRTPQAASYVLHYIVNKYFAMTWSLDMTVVKRPSLLNSAIMVLLFLMR
jgi:phosphopantetheinyl transferase